MFFSQFANPAYNISKALSLIRTVHQLEASRNDGVPLDLIVLPEFLQGSPHQPDPSHYVDIHETSLPRFQELAKELNVNVVPGTISHYVPSTSAAEEEDGEPDGKGNVLLNTAYFINRDGSVAGLYNKKNIWHPERVHYTKGQEPHDTFESQLGKTGMLICWDVMFPEGFKQLAAKDVELLVIPSFWAGDDIELPSGKDDPDTKKKDEEDEDVFDSSELPLDTETKFLKTALTTRAYESGALVVYTNVGGAPSKGYIGCSQVTLPLWGAIPGSRIYDFPGEPSPSASSSVDDVLSPEKFIKVVKVTPGPTASILETSEESLDRIMIVEVGKGSKDGKVSDGSEVRKRLDLAEKMYKIREDARAEDWHY